MRDRGQFLDQGGAAHIPPALAMPTLPPPSSGRPVPMSVRVEQEIGQLTEDLLEALHQYRTAKRVYAARMAVFEKVHGPTAEADIAAKTDYRRARAISDCAWHRGEVMAASNALIALIALRSLAGGRTEVR